MKSTSCGASDQRPTPPVLFVSADAQLGGAELYLHELVERLPPECVTGVVTLADGPFVARLQARGFRVDVIPSPGKSTFVLAGVRLRRLLCSQGVPLVHAHGVKAAAVSVVAAFATPAQVIWHKVDFSATGLIGRVIARQCSLVLAVSQGVADALGAPSNIRVLHYGVAQEPVDRVASREALLELVECSPDCEIIVLAGRLHPGKGQLDLLHALPAIARRRPQAHVVLLGAEDRYEPGYAGRLRETARDLGVDGRVSFLGHRDGAATLLAGADVLAMPSLPHGGWREGFGIVVAEALVAGTPVVAYAEASLPEVLNGCGRLVPRGDIDALAEAISAVLEDEQLRQALRECGKRRARAFDVDEKIRELRAIYASLAVRDIPAISTSGKLRKMLERFDAILRP